MNAGTNGRAAYMALVGVAGIFLTASTCLGFGGVSVGVGGVGVSVGDGGVGVSAGTGGGTGVSAGAGGGSTGVSAGTGGGGVGVSAGTGGGGAGVSVEGGDGGGGVAIGGGGDEAGVGGTSISSGGIGSGAGDSGASVQTGAAAGNSNSSQQQALARQRAFLEMGMNPVRPDRGMKQALSNYYAKTPAASAPAVADHALNSAVSDLPELPSAESPSAMTAPVQSAIRTAQSEVESPERATAADSSEDPAGSPAAYLPAASSSRASSAKASTDEPATPSRQQTALPPKGVIASASVGSFARGGTPSTLNRADDPVGQQKMEKTPAKQPAFASRVVHDTAKTTVVIVPPVQAIATSVVADGSAGQPALITHLGQGWDIAGIFPALKTSSLPTAVPVLIVMLLSAAGAYGFVRLVSEKCPRCAALLERHSTGCRNCGAQLRPADRSNLRTSV